MLSGTDYVISGRVPVGNTCNFGFPQNENIRNDGNSPQTQPADVTQRADVTQPAPHVTSSEWDCAL